MCFLKDVRIGIECQCPQDVARPCGLDQTSVLMVMFQLKGTEFESRTSNDEILDTFGKIRPDHFALRHICTRPKRIAHSIRQGEDPTLTNPTDQSDVISDVFASNDFNH